MTIRRKVALSDKSQRIDRKMSTRHNEEIMFCRDYEKRIFLPGINHEMTLERVLTPPKWS